MKYYWSWEELPERELIPGIRARAVCGEHAMVNDVHARPGARIPNLNHVCEQISLIVKGKMRVTTDDGEEHILKAGDIWYIPERVNHSAEYLEETHMIEVFGPARLEYLPGFLKDTTEIVGE